VRGIERIFPHRLRHHAVAFAEWQAFGGPREWSEEISREIRNQYRADPLRPQVGELGYEGDNVTGRLQQLFPFGEE